MKKLLLAALSVLLIAACTSTENQEETVLTNKYKVLIGAYTQENPNGIYYYRLDKNMDNPELVSSLELKNASFLAEFNGVIYAVNEESDGMLQAYRFDEVSGEFTFINEKETGGAHPCHVSVSNGMLYVANYSGGNLAAFPIEADGSIGERTELITNEGSGPKIDRQAGPHIHSVNISPDGSSLWVADLGTDEVIVYDISGEKLNKKYVIKTRPGSGPRHIDFHPRLPIAYVICELESEIAVVSTDSFEILETVNTFSDEFDTVNYPADIHISPDGKYLYGSNRGINDLVIYRVDTEKGKLSIVDSESVRGDFPRNFALSLDGNYVMAANQRSDNVVVFKRDKETGELTATGTELEISMPVFVKFL